MTKPLHEHLPLRPNWFHILVALADEDRHGYAIMQDVDERTGGRVRLWPATLYGSIKDLLDAGFIAETDERPAPELDDRRRRYYRITESGRELLALETERLGEMVETARARNRGEEVAP